MIVWISKAAWESSGFEHTDASCVGISQTRSLIDIVSLPCRPKFFPFGSGCAELRELQLLD